MTSLQRSLLITAALLLTLSLLTLSSISEEFFIYQLVWIIVGISLVLILHFFDWRPFVNNSWIIYGIYWASIVLLIITYFTAPVIRGIRAWLVLGPLQFQTAELAKVALVLFLASFFALRHMSIASARTIFFSGVLALIPIGFVILQPDLGSALVLGALWFSFLLMSGLPLRYIGFFLLLAVILGAVGWYSVLEPYHKERIVGLFNPESDPLGVNWSVTQAKIAIGSAGFFGKGYGQGTQVQLGFLPEAHSDFIFAAFTEEWGLLGGIVFLLLFVYFIFMILKIGMRSNTNFERFIALGTATIFTLHFLINIGSTLGLLPVIGIPISFMSYGGSHLISGFFLLGMVYSIAGRLS